MKNSILAFLRLFTLSSFIYAMEEKEVIKEEKEQPNQIPTEETSNPSWLEFQKLHKAMDEKTEEEI